MRKFILMVAGVVTMLVGAMMFIASPAMAAENDWFDHVTFSSPGCHQVTVHNGNNSDPGYGPIGVFNDGPNPEFAVQPGESVTFTASSSSVDANFQVVHEIDGTLYTHDVTVTTDCPPAPTEVTPQAPSQSGNNVTIPNVDCVTYLVNGSPVTGTIAITKDTTVTAVPGNGCVFPDGTKDSWTFTYTAPATDPVLAPAASISLNKSGAGVATLDNTGSTESVSFEVVVNGKITSVSVAAGKVVKHSFNAKCGTTVVVNALDTRLAKKSAAACSPSTPSHPTHPVTGSGGHQSSNNGGQQPSYVAPHTGASDGGLPVMPFALMGVGGIMLLGVGGASLRRRLMN